MRIVTFSPEAAAIINAETPLPQPINTQRAVTLGAIGETTDDVSFDWSTLPAALLQLLQAPNIISAQNSLRDINVQRAQKGLPPLSDNYLRAIQPGVNVTLDDSTRNTIILGALAIGALFFLGRRA